MRDNNILSIFDIRLSDYWRAAKIRSPDFASLLSITEPDVSRNCVFFRAEAGS